MKKRVLAMLLALVMVISLLPSVVVAEENGEAHIHCLCGAVKTENVFCAECGSEAVTWTGIDALPVDNQDGYYYLNDSIHKTVSRTFTHNVAFCLNGHDIVTESEGCMSPQNGGVISITDCDGDDTKGLITGTTAKSALPVLAGGVLKLYNGTVTGNTNGSSTGAGIVWLQNGTATTNGGTFYMYGGKIVNNTTKRGAVFAEFPTATTKPASIYILGGEISGNTGLNSSVNTGGGAGIYAAVNVVVGGDAKVYGNIGSVSGTSAPNADIYLRNDNAAYSGQLVVSAEKPLEEGANICYGSNPAAADLTNLTNITGAPESWSNTWVSYDGQKVGYADGKFLIDNSVEGGHVHCLCGAETTYGNTCASCGSKAEEWTATATMPADDGYYYLTGEVSAHQVGISKNIAICLHGQNIKSASGGNIINVQTGGTLTVTECLETPGSITGATTNSAIWLQKGAVFNLYNGKITGNSNASSGGSGTILLHQGDATTNGGAFYMYGGEISGNTNLRGAIYTNVPANAANKTTIVQILGGKITGNVGNQTAANMGGGAGIYAYTPITIGGDAVIANNNAAVNADDIYLRRDGIFTGMLVVSEEKPLEEGANICYGSNIAEADLADLQFITGNPANWNNTWVTYDGDAVGYADGKFFAETPDAEKHIHCLCGAEVNKGETCALCGSVATEWTKTATMPTAAGNYYLTADLSVSQVALDKKISICLCGHDIKSATGSYIINVMTGSELIVTDCQEEQGSITGATTNSAIWLQKGSVFKLYNGKISGNRNASNGGSGTILLHQGDTTTNGGAFYMYGGEISGNTNLRGAIYTNVPTDAANKTAIVQILGGKITENNGTQTAVNMGGGAGIYTYTPVTIGGSAVIANNKAQVNTDDIYLRTDGIFTGSLIVSAEVPLTDGANILYGAKDTDYDEDLQFITGAPENWDSSWVVYKGKNVKYKDGKFYTAADIVISTHEHDGREWISVTEETTLLPNKTGYYVLDGDVQLEKTIVIASGVDVVLCLNGHTLTAAEGANHFEVRAGGKLTICDCTAKTSKSGKYTAGKITGGRGANGGAIMVRAGAELYLYDGIMTDNQASNNGGFVYLEGANDTNAGAAFYMYGGMICNNYGGYGAAIRMGAPTGENAGSAFIMEGGIICNNESPNYGGALHAAGGATIDLIGGVIEENIAAQGGGALSINGNSVLNLSGTIIRNNTATTWAGGVYVKNGATLNISGGEISGNSAKVGAGVLMENTGTVTNMSGGVITGNKAGAAGGGGIYASTSTTFNMTGGIISKNSSEANGGGITLNSAFGNLTGGEISENASSSSGAGVAILGGEVTLGKVTISKNASKSAAGGVYIARSGDKTANVIIDGAQIINNTAKTVGGGMFVYMNGNTVTMKSGKINNNSSQDGGGVVVQREITFTMEGGEICGNTAQTCGGYYASIDSTFIMNGGTISGNYASKNAGGMYALRSKVYLNGGTISGNEAKVAAGGISINGAKAQLNGTSITYNHAETGSGGGVMVNSTTAKVDGVATRFAGRLDINAGVISYNTTKKAAAGLLVQSQDTVVNMYGGKISNNTATKFSGGVYVGKDAMFNMHGGAVCYNVAETDVAGGIRHDAGGGNYTGGEVYGNTCARSGGGIMVGGTNNKVNLKNVKIYDNQAKIGAGLVHQGNGAVLRIEDCEVYNNTATQDAAGIYVATYCEFYADNSHFHHNVAPGNGGGVYSWATSYVYLTDCLIENNEAKAQGGGVWTRGDGFYITGCTIRNNTASGHGGGVCTGMMGSATHAWTPGMQIKDTLFENNTSGGIGGGLYLSGGAQGNLRDVTFTGNTSAAEGGAFWAKDELMMHGITATGNQSGGEGYAIYLYDSEYDGHSYMHALIRISGNMKIHDNPGGDLYLGKDTCLLIGDELLGEDTRMDVTIHSGLLTQLVWGAYNYEGGNQQYTITYGDRSMTDPEIIVEEPENPVEDPTQGGESVEDPTEGNKDNNNGNTGLFIGIGAVVAVIAAAAVIIVAAASKKKKVTK